MGGFFSSTPEVDMDGPEAEMVREMIHDKCVIVFSKTHCSYCRTVQDIFDSVNAQYETVELDKRGDGDKIQAVLAQMTGANTVPRVFIKGKCIGGGTETKALHEEGKLVPMLQECNAIIE